VQESVRGLEADRDGAGPLGVHQRGSAARGARDHRPQELQVLVVVPAGDAQVARGGRGGRQGMFEFGDIEEGCFHLFANTTGMIPIHICTYESCSKYREAHYWYLSWASCPSV
jgi:hypothetical protein